MDDLTPSQKLAFEFFLDSDQNVFLTGDPGTGKSYLAKKMIRSTNKRFVNLASTGFAAVLIGGRTFHSFFKLGTFQGNRDLIIQKALSDKRVINRLKKIDGIILDEISMLSDDVLSGAEEIARIARNSELPWGGIRVIAVGDFAQLPPVSQTREKRWAFQGEVWHRSDFKVFELKEQKRIEDPEFYEILSQLRFGNVTSEISDFLNTKVCLDEEIEENVPRVFPRRKEADEFNRLQLQRIRSDLKTFDTKYTGNTQSVERIKRVLPIQDKIEVKRNALIMIRTNDPKGRYINGTLGTIRNIFDDRLVVELESKKEIELEPFTFTMLDGDGEEIATAINFPISLAYAFTIHKVQGLTLSRGHFQLKGLWECGQAYVALSRTRRAKDFTLYGWDPRSIISDSSVKEFYSSHRSN